MLYQNLKTFSVIMRYFMENMEVPVRVCKGSFEIQWQHASSVHVYDFILYTELFTGRKQH